jgi:maleate cis-trans isomerase
VEALKATNCRNLVVATLYEDEIDQRPKRHLEQSGFEGSPIAA